MSDDRLAQARAEAERRQAAKYQRMWEDEGEHLSHSWSMGFLAGFREGVEWADAHPVTTNDGKAVAWVGGVHSRVP